MSKTKSGLPEDINLLTGNELDGTPTEPSEVDNAINELTRATRVLKNNRNALQPYTDSIKTLAVDMNVLYADSTKAPF